MQNLTKLLRPYFKNIKKAVEELEYYLDEYPMVEFDIDEEDAEALRWLKDNIFV